MKFHSGTQEGRGWNKRFISKTAAQRNKKWVPRHLLGKRLAVVTRPQAWLQEGAPITGAGETQDYLYSSS